MRELDHKEGWALKNWCFWTVVLEKTLESPLDCKEIKPVNLCISQSDAKSQFIGNNPEGGKDWGQMKMRVTENEVVEWHHQLNGHEFEQTPGDNEWQGSLACCSLWGCKKSDTTEQLNKNTDIKGEVESNTIIVRDFSISFTSIDKSFRQNKETQALNDTIDQLYWIE